MRPPTGSVPQGVQVAQCRSQTKSGEIGIPGTSIRNKHTVQANRVLTGPKIIGGWAVLALRDYSPLPPPPTQTGGPRLVYPLQAANVPVCPMTYMQRYRASRQPYRSSQLLVPDLV